MCSLSVSSPLSPGCASAWSIARFGSAPGVSTWDPIAQPVSAALASRELAPTTTAISCRRRTSPSASTGSSPPRPCRFSFPAMSAAVTMQSTDGCARRSSASMSSRCRDRRSSHERAGSARRPRGDAGSCSGLSCVYSASPVAWANALRLMIGSPTGASSGSLMACCSPCDSGRASGKPAERLRGRRGRGQATRRRARRTCRAAQAGASPDSRPAGRRRRKRDDPFSTSGKARRGRVEARLVPGRIPQHGLVSRPGTAAARSRTRPASRREPGRRAQARRGNRPRRSRGRPGGDRRP